MKEDILEQIAEDWLLSSPGCFAKANVKYRPHGKGSIKSKDSNHSDIDIIALFIDKTKRISVKIVSCKSWQGGFSRQVFIEASKNKAKYSKNQKMFREKRFRELFQPKWTKAFLDEIERQTFSKTFQYYIAVTRETSNTNAKINQDFAICCRRIKTFFKKQYGVNISIQTITVKVMLKEIRSRARLDQHNLTNEHTLEPSMLGRLLQVINGADLTVKDIKEIFPKVVV